MNYPPLEVVVEGEYACFTRPEMKVERVSYPVMTPSAARGILEAIFWKPEFYWHIREIAVLKKIQWFSIKRNEVSSRISYRAVQGWSSPDDGYFADDDRTQRATLMLHEVGYLIIADIYTRNHTNRDPAAYRDQFRRRVSRGACFHRPALGCREFAADFREPNGTDRPIEDSADLGRMLFDIDFDPEKDPESRKSVGTGTPVFFDARLENGVLKVPQELYDELRWTKDTGGGEK